eukprot:Pgem_evm1s6558
MIYNTLAEAQRLQQPNPYFVKEDYNLNKEDLDVNVNIISERERRNWFTNAASSVANTIEDAGEVFQEHVTDPIRDTVVNSAHFVEDKFDKMNDAVEDVVEKVDDFVNFDSVANILADPMTYLNPLGTFSKYLSQTNFQGDEFRKCDPLKNFNQALSANDKIRRPFSYHVMSDPQLFWDHDKKGDVRDAAEKYNGNVAAAMNRYRDSRGQKPISVVINGDLTAYFRPTQLKSFRKFYHNSDSTLQYKKVYLGLGNHDIENNLKNGCKWTSLLDLPNLMQGDAGCSLAAMEFADKNLRCETGGWKAQGTTLRAYNRKAHAYAWVEN